MFFGAIRRLSDEKQCNLNACRGISFYVSRPHRLRASHLPNYEFFFVSILEGDLHALTSCLGIGIGELIGREKILLHHRPSLTDLNRNKTTPGQCSVSPDIVVVNLGDHTALANPIRRVRDDVLTHQGTPSAFNGIGLARGLSKQQQVLP